MWCKYMCHKNKRDSRITMVELHMSSWHLYLSRTHVSQEHKGLSNRLSTRAHIRANGRATYEFVTFIYVANSYVPQKHTGFSNGLSTCAHIHATMDELHMSSWHLYMPRTHMIIYVVATMDELRGKSTNSMAHLHTYRGLCVCKWAIYRLILRTDFPY